MENEQVSKANRFYLIRVNFILSIMIVWHHAYNVDTFRLSENDLFVAKGLLYIENFFSIFQLVAVPMFFLISGYLFFINYTWNKVIQKYKTRIRSLLIPYLVWNTIVYIFFFVLTRINFINKYINMTKIELSGYDLYRNIIFSDINSSMWFIRALIILVLFSPLFYWALNKSKKFGCFFVLVSFIIYYIFPIGQHTFLFALPFFLLGGFIAKYYQQQVFLHIERKVSIAGLVLLVVLIYIYIKYNVFDLDRVRHIILLVEVSVFWIFIRGLECLKSKSSPPWYFRISFFIFCLHGIVLESIEKVMYITFGNNVICAYIDYFLAPVITLLVILFAAVLLRSKCVHVWNVLNGNR